MEGILAELPVGVYHLGSHVLIFLFYFLYFCNWINQSILKIVIKVELIILSISNSQT